MTEKLCESSPHEEKELWERYNNINELLNELMKHKTQGAIVRSKIEWTEKGQKVINIF